MTKEANVYLFVLLLAVGVFLSVYYLNLSPTGFAVFGESGTNFQGTFENTTTGVNDSSVVLDTNQTTGTYTSDIFDANSSVTWNNLTWTGTGNLTFQVRSCSTSDCANEIFSTLDLNNLNLTGQYFQYIVFFDSSTMNGTNETLSLDSVSVEYSNISAPVAVTTVTVSEPSGSKSTSTGISLEFASSGENLTCWYDVHDASDNAMIKDNATVSNCTNVNTTFNLGAGDGDYVLNVYVNGTSGFASDSSDFSIKTPTNPDAEQAAPVVETPVEPATAPVQETPKVTSISSSDISVSKMTPGSSQDLTLTVQNTGTEPVSDCSLSVSGDSASWISVPEGKYNLNSGDSQDFKFTVNVPEETEDGSSTLTAAVTCTETATTKSFTVEVEKQKLDFQIIDAQRTSTSRVRVDYSLKELTGAKQTVELYFSILDLSNNEVANVSINKSIGANSTKEYSINIPLTVNKSQNDTFTGNFSLSATANSEVYKTSVLEPITLGAPIGGFAAFQGVGAGGYILLVVVVLALAISFVVVRRIRGGSLSLKSAMK